MTSSSDPFKKTEDDLEKSTGEKTDTTDSTSTEKLNHESEAVKEVLEDLLEDKDNS